MSERTRIDHAEVSRKTRDLKSALRGHLVAMEQKHGRHLTLIQQMDGEANAELQAIMAQNLKKAETAAEILEKLLTFIQSSARQVMMQENRIASRYANPGTAVPQ